MATKHVGDVLEAETPDPSLGVFVTTMLALVVLMLCVTFLLVALRRTGDVATIEPDAEADLVFVDPANVPTIYTGELVDFTADGVPDVALFGDPMSPTIRPIREEVERRWLDLLLPAIFGIFVAISAGWAANQFR